MKATFYPSINSKCGMCKCDLDTGGYLIRDSKDNIIKTLCPICKDTEEAIDNVTKIKRSKLVVKQVKSFLSMFFEKHYEVISSKNLLITENVLSHSEVIAYLDNSNVDVEIKL